MTVTLDVPTTEVCGVMVSLSTSFFAEIKKIHIGPDGSFGKFFKKLDGAIHFAFPEISAEICPG